MKDSSEERERRFLLKSIIHLKNLEDNARISNRHKSRKNWISASTGVIYQVLVDNLKTKKRKMKVPVTSQIL